jgi:DNA polymerase-3 subunit epsilon
MMDFAAIDFETANEAFSSICSVGIIIVREGKIAGKYYSLIKPEPDYYHYRNIMVHGIHPEDTENAPVFSVVWKEVEPLIQTLPLVAHNKAFDENCLKAAFRTYQIDYPGYIFHCTLQAARKQLKQLPNHKLPTVAACCGYDLSDRHHHALADAEACARIALALL